MQRQHSAKRQPKLRIAKHAHRLNWRRLWVVIGLVMLLLIGSGLFYASANQPRAVAQDRVTALAKSKAKLTRVSNFFVYHQDQTYYAVAGVDQHGKQVLVLVPDHRNQVTVIDQATGINGRQAIHAVQDRQRIDRVLHTALGKYHHRIVWEVAYLDRHADVNYALVDFKTGKLVQQINL